MWSKLDKMCIAIGSGKNGDKMYHNLDHPANKGKIKRNMHRYRVVGDKTIFMESPTSIDKKMREEMPF